MQFHELHFIELPSPSNIYSLALAKGETAGQTIIVSCRTGVFLVTSHILPNEPPQTLRELAFETHELHLSNMPTPIIVAVESFCPVRHNVLSDTPVLAVAWQAMTDESEGPGTFLLGIYGAADLNALSRFVAQSSPPHPGTSPFSEPASYSSSTPHLGSSSSLPPLWSSVSADGRSIRLAYVPLHVTHTEIVLPGDQRESVVLVGGDDGRVHIYSLGGSSELDAAECGIEVVELPGSVTWISKTEQVTAVASQDGTIQVGWGDGRRLSRLMEGVVSSVQILQSFNPTRLLVAEAVGRVVILEARAQEEMPIWGRLDLLPDSDAYDAVLCVLAVDVNGNGKEEVLVGTYGKMLLLYEETGDSDRPYALTWRQPFNYPVMALACADVTGDGVHEIVVISLFGVHIFQRRY